MTHNFKPDYFRPTQTTLSSSEALPLRQTKALEFIYGPSIVSIPSRKWSDINDPERPQSLIMNGLLSLCLKTQLGGRYVTWFC